MLDQGERSGKGVLCHTPSRIPCNIFDRNSQFCGSLEIDIVHTCGSDTDELKMGGCLHGCFVDNDFIGEDDVTLLDSLCSLFCDSTVIDGKGTEMF